MLVNFALRNISRNRRRSLVAIGTIAVGVFGLLFLQTFFAGLLAMHAENSIHSRHGHGQIMSQGYWEQSFENPSAHWLEKPADLVASLQQNPLVSAVFPRVSFFALLSNGVVNVSGKGQGVVGSSEQQFFNKLNFVAGGPLGERADGIVLGLGLARTLGVKPGDRVTVLGNTIHGSVNAIDTTVTGIFHVGMKEADDMLFQVQLPQAQTLLDTDKLETIAIGLHDPETWGALASSLQTKFTGIDALSVFEIDQAWAENGRLFLTALMNVFRLTFLGMIMLAIYNSASNTVLERRRELGMLRANGESVSDLVRLLAIEGLAIAVAGSLLGMAMLLVVNVLAHNGIVMPPTPGTNRALPVKLALEPGFFITAMFLGVGTSVAATLLSTAQIARLSIVQAIRAPV